MRRAGLRLALAALVLGLSGAALGQVYVWTDAEGGVHITDDLSSVPAVQRPAAVERAHEPKPGRWNEIPASRAASAGAGARKATTAVHVIRVHKAGLEMSVGARLDGGVVASFVVDTGAMINTVPRNVAEQVGLRIDENTPVTVVTGISGTPQMVPVITVREVDLGGARVENVEMAVVDSMQVGLLGMPFFNHFKVSTDPLAGTLTLEEIDLSSADGVYGGYDETYWRGSFRRIRLQLERIRTYRASVPGMYGEALDKLDASEAYWQNQYELLELRASRAGVPRPWRE